MLKRGIKMIYQHSCFIVDFQLKNKNCCSAIWNESSYENLNLKDNVLKYNLKCIGKNDNENIFVTQLPFQIAHQQMEMKCLHTDEKGVYNVSGFI